MNRVKRNDNVMVISGNHAGKTGRVVRVYPKTERVMVEGVNLKTKHERTRMTRQGRQGGITTAEAPLHMSNVMPICPSCDQPTRVGVRIVNEQRTRYCRKCEAEF